MAGCGFGEVLAAAGCPGGAGGGRLTSPPGRSQGEAPMPAEHPGGSSRPQGRAGRGAGGAIAAHPPRAAAAPLGHGRGSAERAARPAELRGGGRAPGQQ